MIVFDLACQPAGHRFEGWFGSSEDFAAQKERGLVACPQCGSHDVEKAVMAPRVGRKGNQSGTRNATSPARTPVASEALPPEVAQAMQKLARMQGEALKNSRWVGDDFAEQSRAMHYGERERETIHGEATAEEAHALIDEGIEVAPLPFPVAPPDETN
ncbi:hypothetical protein GCM10011371_06010 [Novosphingobium marinum]|uniref:DUF1178 family protein n=1 Tax=Novosphingobium marinum TaxID=1514948 RepID=A0A7Y9XTI0_9SPHN|nr:DUF1178 family protein [Novosphingobium marinum]NYH94289.1 hypothetical protein [Novosphingobium marinum]GGC21146.1 hypothetical protein GCM10011371_06010 [Novosphingobium marinum]